jgi:hypothetical protein
MHKRLNTSAFFLFGVIVGLSIREALVRISPHLLLPSDVVGWQVRLEALRLVVFLFTIVCFYFGASHYFDKVYVNDDTAAKFIKKSYGLDFASALVHFLIFFGWGTTATDHSRFSWGGGPFLLFLGAVLLYDLVWLLANRKNDSVQEIKIWTFMACAVSALAGLVFFLVRAISANDVIAEAFALIIVMVYILVDFAELVSGKTFSVDMIKKILPK